MEIIFDTISAFLHQTNQAQDAEGTLCCPTQSAPRELPPAVPFCYAAPRCPACFPLGILSRAVSVAHKSIRNAPRI